MCDLSLMVLDLVMNAVKAKARAIHIFIKADTQSNRLILIILDNGTGMKDTQAAVHPFVTTSAQKQIGLGLPLFRYAVLRTGGSFHLSSNLGGGTVIRGEFVLSSLERPPLGNLAQTMFTLCAGSMVNYELTLENSEKSKTRCFIGGCLSEAESVLKRTEELTLKMFGGILSEISF